jgi:hypothetical protein
LVDQTYEELQRTQLKISSRQLDSIRDIDVLQQIPEPDVRYHEWVLQEDARLDRLMETIDQVTNMDLTIKRPKTMVGMLKYKVEEANELKVESVIVEGEYRLGMNDPSRMAAQWEKMKGVRKEVGRKRTIQGYMKRVNNMHDNKLSLNVNNPR